MQMPAPPQYKFSELGPELIGALVRITHLGDRDQAEPPELFVLQGYLEQILHERASGDHDLVISRTAVVLEIAGRLVEVADPKPDRRSVEIVRTAPQ